MWTKRIMPIFSVTALGHFTLETNRHTAFYWISNLMLFSHTCSLYIPLGLGLYPKLICAHLCSPLVTAQKQQITELSYNCKYSGATVGRAAHLLHPVCLAQVELLPGQVLRR